MTPYWFEAFLDSVGTSPWDSEEFDRFNQKMLRDYSCVLFNRAGDVISSREDGCYIVDTGIIAYSGRRWFYIAYYKDANNIFPLFACERV